MTRTVGLSVALFALNAAWPRWLDIAAIAMACLIWGVTGYYEGRRLS